MSTERVERRLTAILAADVAGYSRLTGLDEEGTHARLQDHLRSLADPKIAEHRGRVVKNRGQAGALVVAEPTTNRPLCGHRGALWLKATTRGVTAHGSMPEKGVNAIYAAARAVGRLEAFDFNVARHPVMGAPTLNVGTLHGGLNINSVPDRAEIGIDIRTIPGMRHGPLRDQVASHLGSEVALKRNVKTAPNRFTRGAPRGRVNTGPDTTAPAPMT